MCKENAKQQHGLTEGERSLILALKERLETVERRQDVKEFGEYVVRTLRQTGIEIRDEPEEDDPA